MSGTRRTSPVLLEAPDGSQKPGYSIELMRVMQRQQNRSRKMRRTAVIADKLIRSFRQVIEAGLNREVHTVWPESCSPMPTSEAY